MSTKYEFFFLSFRPFNQLVKPVNSNSTVIYHAGYYPVIPDAFFFENGEHKVMLPDLRKHAVIERPGEMTENGSARTIHSNTDG